MTNSQETICHVTEILKHIDALIAAGEQRSSRLAILNRANEEFTKMLPVGEQVELEHHGKTWLEGEGKGRWTDKVGTRIPSWSEIPDDVHPIGEAMAKKGLEL